MAIEIGDSVLVRVNTKGQPSRLDKGIVVSVDNEGDPIVRTATITRRIGKGEIRPVRKTS